MGLTSWWVGYPKHFIGCYTQSSENRFPRVGYERDGHVGDYVRNKMILTITAEGSRQKAENTLPPFARKE
jgi:hypothetical protein